MADNDARAALAARQEDFDPLGPVAFVPLVRVKWREELRASTARGSGGR